MGLILDLAVVALAVVVIGSLALLSWTLAVSAVRAAHRGRTAVADARGAVADTERRIGDTAPRTAAGLARLTRRVERTSAGRSIEHHPGDDPDA